MHSPVLRSIARRVGDSKLRDAAGLPQYQGFMEQADSEDRVDDDEGAAASGSAWRYAMASRAHIVVDAAAYFELMNEAMMEARQRIMLIGWDFDSRIRLAGGRRWWNLHRKDHFPARFGAFVVWLVKRRPGLEVRVLKWNFGALKFIFRGSMILDLLRWYFTKGLEFKFDSAHPLGCSHHQKIVVIDDRFAVCGGIDMTSDRWDTPAHLEGDTRRQKINGKTYGPWHDLTMLLEGDVARALGELGRRRWRQAGGRPIRACQPQQESAWPQRLHAEFNNVEVGIARTRAAYRDISELREVETLFVEQIGRARRFIYAESQYFASRRIAEAIAQKLAEPDPPEIVLINPQSSSGWLEQAAMDGARVRLLHAIAEKDHRDRFRIFVPLASGGTPIYVHAKMMIVDDEIVRVGSANMNNRSMGLDSEADVFIDATRPANRAQQHDIGEAIRRLRNRLLAEHCGLSVECMADLLETHGSMIAAIEETPMPGKRLVPFALRPLTDTEKAVADSTLLDPERPEELFEPIRRRRGLFRRGGILRRPV
jgi:phosphatidylserine/phosphatidylglycerophosphate/cardiolipin synthase-like enzyme